MRDDSLFERSQSRKRVGKGGRLKDGPDSKQSHPTIASHVLESSNQLKVMKHRGTGRYISGQICYQLKSTIIVTFDFPELFTEKVLAWLLKRAETGMQPSGLAAYPVSGPLGVSAENLVKGPPGTRCTLTLWPPAWDRQADIQRQSPTKTNKNNRKNKIFEKKMVYPFQNC